MHLDVTDLRSFYYGTRLGRAAQRAVQRACRELWPDTRGAAMVGYGFAAPFLRSFRSEAARTLALMPDAQGVCHWPPEGPNLAALVEETRWPLPTGFVDRLIVAHGLETCERPAALLDEIWRVLAPGGKAVFIAPNRSGLWARRDATPFGYGRPYSFGQLEMQLSAHSFVVERRAAALYAPPSHERFWLRAANTCERVGQRFDAQRFAGVILVEASKQVYVAPSRGGESRARRPLDVLEGWVAPKPAIGRSSRVASSVDPA